jgi:hypothetical protein
VAVLALLSRAIWRHRVRSLVVLAIVGGIGLGVVMTAVAAARRADGAYTRLRNDALAPDVFSDGDRPVMPIGIVAAAVVAAVLVANLMAYVMARPLARVAPAVALRTE